MVRIEVKNEYALFNDEKIYVQKVDYSHYNFVLNLWDKNIKDLSELKFVNLSKCTNVQTGREIWNYEVFRICYKGSRKTNQLKML